MGWIDGAAVSVISRKYRMVLLNTLNIEEECDRLVESLKIRHHLSKWQCEKIYNSKKCVGRVKILIDLLSSKMTTALFSDFLHALGDHQICGLTELRLEMLHAYKIEGGSLTTEMLHWMDNDESLNASSSLNSLNGDSVTYEEVPNVATDTIDFGQLCAYPEDNKTHKHCFQSPITCFHFDRVSKRKPLVIATYENEDVTDISQAEVTSKLTFYDLFDKKVAKEYPLIGHSGKLLKCFAVEDGKYCMLSSRETQKSSPNFIQIFLWYNDGQQCGKYEEVDLTEIEWDSIEKVSACVVLSEEKAVLLIFSQNSCKVLYYFISDDKIEYGGYIETAIDTITDVRSINIHSKHYCAFWGGNELELYEIDASTGLDPKSTIEVSGEISCCEFIPSDCENSVLLSVSHCSPERAHSIDLWCVSQRTRKIQEACLQNLDSTFAGSKSDMLFVGSTQQLIVCIDHRYIVMNYDSSRKELTQQTCDNVPVIDSSDTNILKQELLKFDDRVYSIWSHSCNTALSFTPIPLME